MNGYSVADYSERDFFRHMRVTEATALHYLLLLYILLSNYTFKVDEFWSNITFHEGGIPLEIEESLYITFHYLANQGSIRSIGDKFGRTESKVQKSCK